MRDQDDTHPNRKAPAQCPSCLWPRPSHSEFCLVVADLDRIRREMAAKAHFFRMTQRERVLALAIGAAQRGTTFHYHGDLR